MQSRPKPSEIGPLIATLLSIALAILGLLELAGLPFAFSSDNSRITFAAVSVAIGTGIAILSLSRSRGRSREKYKGDVVYDTEDFELKAPSSKPRFATKKPTVTGEVKIPASMKPFAYYNLNVSLIGDQLPEQTVTISGEVTELRPFQALKTGPIKMVPHGENFDVQPEAVSSQIPVRGQRHQFSFKVSPKFEHLEQTKFFVDFIQGEKLLARANADIKITGWVDQPSYKRIFIGVF